jgi:hypothetical protein
VSLPLKQAAKVLEFRLERHHRKPRSKKGGNEPRNISMVRSGLHIAYHKLFQNKDAEEVAEVLNKTWIDPDKILICVDRADLKILCKLFKQLNRHKYLVTYK